MQGKSIYEMAVTAENGSTHRTAGPPPIVFPATPQGNTRSDAIYRRELPNNFISILRAMWWQLAALMSVSVRQHRTSRAMLSSIQYGSTGSTPNRRVGGSTLLLATTLTSVHCGASSHYPPSSRHDFKSAPVTQCREYTLNALVDVVLEVAMC